jgi:dTDP-4-amino-4,6-dideoxygalactose transaminase
VTLNLDKRACKGIIKEAITAEPIMVELVSSRILKIFNPIKAPGIRIKKRTALAAPKESPKEPLSKNGVKNRDNESTNQILNLTTIWLFFSVLSTSQLYAKGWVSMAHMQVPFYRHSLAPENSKYVAKVLETPFLTSGPIGKEVEAQLSEYFGVKHAKLVNSWTNGAVATLLALDIGPGDEVIVPAMTFIATANVVELVGAKPVFIDCDPDTLLVTPALIKDAITDKTKAIIPVHMYGQMCDIKAIKEIIPSGQKIAIIEDCAHSFEAKLNGERPGKYSEAAIFSFYATKNITCGEGGAIITNNPELFERIIQSILHGMSAGAVDRFNSGKYKHWGMEHLGTKANLPDLLACMLPDQINLIDEKLHVRERLANKYEEALRQSEIRFPMTLQNVIHARHLFPIHVKPELRDHILSELGEYKIGTTVNYRAVPSMNYYRNKYKLNMNKFPISEYWGNGTISLPLFPSMELEEQDYVIETILNKILPLIERN